MLQDYRVQEYRLPSPPFFKCIVLRESLSVDSQNIPCAILKRKKWWIISVYLWFEQIRILPSTSKKKIMKKILDFYCFVTSLGLFIIEDWCKCTLQKGISKKTCCRCEGHWRKEQDPDPDPDPLVKAKGTEPKIRIRTKMLRIRNTFYEDVFSKPFSCGNHWSKLPKSRWERGRYFKK